MSIYQVRGTSGSGKTTIVRKLMADLNGFEPVTLIRRKCPLYYLNPKINLAVVGHYESTCGGCDTINSYDLLQDTVRRLVGQGFNVLMEGLLLSEDQKQTKLMADSNGVTVYCFFINVDIETCIERVKKRREEAGNAKPLNESNTRNRIRSIESARLKLTGHPGVFVKRGSSNQIESWLRRLVFQGTL